MGNQYLLGMLLIVSDTAYIRIGNYKNQYRASVLFYKDFVAPYQLYVLSSAAIFIPMGVSLLLYKIVAIVLFFGKTNGF